MEIVMLRCNGCRSEVVKDAATRWWRLQPITANGPVEDYCPTCGEVARKAVREANRGGQEYAD